MKAKVWSMEEEAARLSQRFESVNQASFAREHGVPGGASMITQHKKGHRPISLEAAVAYARGFRVPLEEISPRLAISVRQASPISAPVSEPLPAVLPGDEVVSIPLLSVSGSMGPGEELHDEVVVGRLTLSPQWISRSLPKITNRDNLRFIHGYGDSMEPTFADGDILLVDGGIKEAKVDAIYVLEANERIYVKRVRQRIDGSFEISSDNQTVKTVDVLDGGHEVRVRGRVVWAWNGKRL